MRKIKIFFVMVMSLYSIISTLQAFNTSEVEWKKTAKSQQEKRQLRQALLESPEFTNNYTFEHVESPNELNYLGRGREGIVYIARKINSNQLMAIKVQCDGRDPDHHYDGEEEVEAVNFFHLATGYPFEAHNHPFAENGVSFNAKSFIHGETLQSMMESNRLFDGSLDYDYICAKLRELFNCLINHGLFFADTATENFLFDGCNFYIVDLRPMEHFATGDWKSDPSAYIPFTRRKYHEKILASEEEISWTQDCRYHPHCPPERRAAFQDFLQKVIDGE